MMFYISSITKQMKLYFNEISSINNEFIKFDYLILILKN